MKEILERLRKKRILEQVRGRVHTVGPRELQ